jgi:signal transduction histidine kinase
VLNTLRARLLALFAPLAIVPLLIVGVADYVRVDRTVEQMLAAQTDTAAQRAARVLNDRFALLQSDEQLLAGNVVTQRLLRDAAREEPSRAVASLDATSREYLDHLWEQVNGAYRSVEFQDGRGRVVLSYRETAIDDGTGAPGATTRPMITWPVRDDDDGTVLGAIVLAPRLERFVTPELSRGGFGRTGYNSIVDRQTGVTVDHPLARFVNEPASGWMGGAAGQLGSSPAGSVRFGSGDSLRVAAFAAIDGTPWVVISTTAVAEFRDAFLDVRRLDLLLLTVLALLVSVGIVLLARRATASLEALTSAAQSIGRGNLSPPLPAPTADEVGVLSATMSEMIRRLRAMVREIEISRQMSIIGEFASQIAHEIRNPLTSLKLELQGLARDRRTGAWNGFSDESLETCLHEVQRLDGVVRGVLRLAQPSVGIRGACLVDAVVGRAIAAVSRELEDRGIHIERADDGAGQITIDGDAAALEGALINLLRNAADAQPHGGRIGVFVRARESADVDIIVADDGVGVSIDDRERIFRPFVTSRPDGTGLGLPMVLRVAREHGGTVALNGGMPGFSGAAFVLTLPLASAEPATLTTPTTLAGSR